MSDFIVVGTDTDAGKSTFSLLWLTQFAEDFAYWKPLESGESDSEKVRRLVPGATVYAPIAHFEPAIAPTLAARLAGQLIPTARTISARRPITEKSLLIETFGSPLSPLNETELQIELIRCLQVPAILVTPSTVGAIGRSLALLQVLRSAGVLVPCVILIGPSDEYAREEIARRGEIPAFLLTAPDNWDAEGLTHCTAANRDVLQQIRDLLPSVKANPFPDLLERDARAVWHPYTSLQDPDPPLPVVGAEQEFLTLADGRKLIDGISSWWTILHGHRHPLLMAALRRASEQIDHVLFAGVTHPAAVECAELLLQTTPWSGGKVFFSDNGSTAVEVALKMAYQWWCLKGEPQRTLFVGFEGAYHGDTFGAMAIGRDKLFFGRFDPLLFQSLQIPISAAALDQVLKEHAGKVSAVIIEPLVQGAGGMRMHSPQELRAIFEVARRHQVLFIADEVMTGSRTGTFWAHTQAAIAPDLICTAKTLAGGILSLAATLIAPDIVTPFNTADRSKTFFHGHSFTAHPLACAVAVENLRQMQSGAWQVQSQRIEQTWRRAQSRLSCLENVDEVRICGTLLAVEIDVPGGYLATIGRTLRLVALAERVLLRPLGNVLYAMPPLNTSDESLQQILVAMERAILACATN